MRNPPRPADSLRVRINRGHPCALRHAAAVGVRQSGLSFEKNSRTPCEESASRPFDESDGERRRLRVDFARPLKPAVRAARRKTETARSASHGEKQENRGRRRRTGERGEESGKTARKRDGAGERRQQRWCQRPSAATSSRRASGVRAASSERRSAAVVCVYAALSYYFFFVALKTVVRRERASQRRIQCENF